MWLPPSLVSELDHPEGRSELARRATALARQAIPAADIEILWDGMWIRRVGPHYFPDPELWLILEPDWQSWAGMAEYFTSCVDDFWLHIYKPKPGDTIVDIGAGRGEDVAAFSGAVGPSGRVWAIEPHPVAFQALEKFCWLNGLRNVTALRVACVDRRAQLQIEALPNWQSNYVRTGESTSTSRPVEGVPFDELSAELGIERIDFLKMNIEGAERTALPGCRESLQRTSHVCVAAHDFRADRGDGEEFRTFDFVCSFLREAGFRLVTRGDDPRNYVRCHVHGIREVR